jgi:hypothetical protein
MVCNMEPMKPGQPPAYPIISLVPQLFPSVDWLSRRLNAGIIPGSKIGRKWLMTGDDIRTALETYKNTTAPTASGITAASARRRQPVGQ